MGVVCGAGAFGASLIDMSVRVRALFFISLALIVGQLDVPAAGSTASVAAAPAPDLQPVEAHHEPHPASKDTRGWLPDRRTDRLLEPLLVPSQAANVPLAPGIIEATEPGTPEPSAKPLLLLPPSRAPPALS